jgi:predicted PurR-regulated permease PerM
MPREFQSRKSRPVFPAIFLAATLYVIIHSFSRLAPILLALILTLLLSLALNPLILKLRRLSGGRKFPTVLIVIIFFVIISLTGWAFYTPVQRSTSKFLKRLPEYWEHFQRPLIKMEQKAVISEQRIKREVTTEVAKEDKTNVTDETASSVAPSDTGTTRSSGIIHSGAGALFGGISSSFKGIFTNAASVSVVIITTFFGVIFTLLHPRPIMQMVFGIIPEQHHNTAIIITRRIVEFVPRWALATLMGMGIIGLMIFLAMWPLFGFQDALVLGLIALVFEAVPYVGPIMAAVPALLLSTSEGGLMPLWVLLAYLSVQALENNLIMPVVVGGQLKLHPVAVIFSMLLCVTTFGVLGVLIAMPTVAIFLIFHEEVYRPHFLPHVSDADLERIARATLEKERVSLDEKKDRQAREPKET